MSNLAFALIFFSLIVGMGVPQFLFSYIDVPLFEMEPQVGGVILLTFFFVNLLLFHKIGKKNPVLREKFTETTKGCCMLCFLFGMSVATMGQIYNLIPFAYWLKRVVLFVLFFFAGVFLVIRE